MELIVGFAPLKKSSAVACGSKKGAGDPKVPGDPWQAGRYPARYPGERALFKSDQSTKLWWCSDAGSDHCRLSMQLPMGWTVKPVVKARRCRIRTENKLENESTIITIMVESSLKTLGPSYLSIATELSNIHLFRITFAIPTFVGNQNCTEAQTDCRSNDPSLVRHILKDKFTITCFSRRWQFRRSVGPMLCWEVGTVAAAGAVPCSLLYKRVMLLLSSATRNLKVKPL